MFLSYFPGRLDGIGDMVSRNEREVSNENKFSIFFFLCPRFCSCFLHFMDRNTHCKMYDSFFCRCDKDIKVSYTVYNRMSLLLKSLLAITRVTPAYKLSRKQGHDYVILYRFVCFMVYRYVLLFWPVLLMMMYIMLVNSLTNRYILLQDIFWRGSTYRIGRR